MASVKELNNFYNSIYKKDFPSSTLSKWVKGRRLNAVKENGRYNYDLEQFKQIVTSEEYKNKLKARRENPKDYVGKIRGYLQITDIVPEEEKKENYKGTLMYCKCLRCKKEELIQVRFSYLTPNGNYFQDSCGCWRKEKAFLSSSREGIREEWLVQFHNNFEWYLYLHKLLVSTTDKYYIHCDIDEYEKAIEFLNNNKQLHQVYNFWRSKEKNNTFYDWAKPSLDHIVPKSKGGSNKIDNLQVLTVFENLAKRDMTWEDWCDFKKKTNTSSDYYIENIINL